MKKDKRLQSELLSSLKNRDGIKEIVIPFTNNDVPNFLRRLDRFESKSRKNNMRVG